MRAETLWCPSILLYRNGFLKKWGRVEGKERHVVYLSTLTSRFGYAGINKPGGPPIPVIDTGEGGGPLEHSHAC